MVGEGIINVLYDAVQSSNDSIFYYSIYSINELSIQSFHLRELKFSNEDIVNLLN